MQTQDLGVEAQKQTIADENGTFLNDLNESRFCLGTVGVEVVRLPESIFFRPAAHAAR